MSCLRVRIRQSLLLSCLLGLSLLFGACAQKAKTIQVGAAQFEAESLTAIEKIDQLRRRETEATPMAPEEASAFFVDSVKNSKKPIEAATLPLLLNPLQTNTPQSEAQWQMFLLQMRRQYATFADTFASLDKGSLFAAPAVQETIPILDKLIAQMAVFAQSIREKPVEFIRDRAAIATKLELIRETQPFTAVTDLKLLELERQLRAVAAAEVRMTQDTVTQALKAATLGSKLRELLEKYDQLSVDDIAEGLTRAFKLVGGIPGLDLSGLEAVTDNLVAEIKADETLHTFFNTALAEIGKARSR